MNMMPIAPPKSQTLPSLKSSFHRLLPSKRSRDRYELDDTDSEFYRKICKKLALSKASFTAETLEAVITAWEADTNTDEIIPVERAVVILDE
jgi:hypothetical protein